MYGKPVYHPLNRGFDYYYGLPLSISVDNGDTGLKIINIIFPTIRPKLIVSSVVILVALMCLFLVGLVKLRTFIFLTAFTAMFYAYIYIYFFAMHYTTGVLMKNFETIEMPIRLVGLTQRFALEGVEFIKNQTALEQPFLLFVSWGHTHTFLAPSRRFAGQSRHGLYGDCVEEMDWGIGVVLQALDDTGSRDNTLVYFTSDHGGSLFDFGPSGEMEGGYNGIYRGESAVETRNFLFLLRQEEACLYIGTSTTLYPYFFAYYIL